MKKEILFTAILFGVLITAQGQKSDTLQQIKELKKHLYTLTSDGFGGRYPGTEGSKKASVYIETQFRKNKLIPLGNGFQNFEIVSNVEPTQANYLYLLGQNQSAYKPSFGNDFITYPYSSSDTTECELVFAGYGIELKNDSLQWNDYANIDVAGKCVLVLRGDPDYDKSISPFVGTSTERNKVMIAKEKGAVGVVFVTPDIVDKNDNLVSFKTYQGEVGIPVIQVKKYVADSLLKSNVVTVKQLENKINGERKPNSVVLKYKIKLITGLDVKMAASRNVLAVLPGSDAMLKNEYIVVGAHYDHLGMGGKGSSSMKPDTSAIHYGADDNASGVTAIIGIANKLATGNIKLKRSILFMAFDAEEEGLLGSKYFVNNPLIPLANVKAMMNFDMVGRLNSENKLQLHGTGTALETDTLLKMTLAKYNFKPTFDPGGNGPSDYAAFYGKNIPVIALTTGIHPDYHTPADMPDKINYSGMVKIVDFSSQILIDLANREKPLTFKQVETAGDYKNVRRGKATLGIMPDFSGAEKIGVRVDGVTKGKPAEKAGILKDDIIIGINGTPVKDIYEYMFQMGKHKQGDKIIVDVKRKEETVHMEVEL